MLGHRNGWLGPSVGHLELVCRLEDSYVAVVHAAAFLLSNSYFFRPLVRFLKENDLRNPRKVQNFLNSWLNAGAQIIHDGQVQRPRKCIYVSANGSMCLVGPGGSRWASAYITISEDLSYCIFQGLTCQSNFTKNAFNGVITSYKEGQIEYTADDHDFCLIYVSARHQHKKLFNAFLTVFIFRNPPINLPCTSIRWTWIRVSSLQFLSTWLSCILLPAVVLWLNRSFQKSASW